MANQQGARKLKLNGLFMPIFPVTPQVGANFQIDFGLLPSPRFFRQGVTVTFYMDGNQVGRILGASSAFSFEYEIAASAEWSERQQVSVNEEETADFKEEKG